MPDPAELLALALVGLLAGALGGLLGIGGSIIMIPGVTLLLHKDQHMAQAAAMIVNAFVAAPAAFRHHRAEAVRWDVMARMLPFAIVFILLGVAASDQFTGVRLQQMFGVFLIYVVINDGLKLIQRSPDGPKIPAPAGWWSAGFVGSIMGFAAGLLGIGAGIIAVPLLQRFCRLPLRHAIATSSAAMCLTAIVGSVRKNMTLPDHGLSIAESLIIAACLAPTAFAGGFLGAGLTHALPLKWVRVAFLLLVIWASLEMLGVL